MRDRLRGLWARLLAACFQTRCIACKAWASAPLCTSCDQPLPPFPSDACPRCLGSQTPCPLCTASSPLAQVYAAAPYTGLMRLAIHALKFDGRPELADWLAAHMTTSLPQLDSDWILVAVPLSGDRLRSRGYNQANWLAQRIRGYAKAPQLLRRSRFTPSQVGQGRDERWQGMRDAFEASPDVKGKRILLVDDVLTTGATLTWAAHALKSAGAAEVRALVAARAQLKKKGQVSVE